MVGKRGSVEFRFWSKVVRGPKCWKWVANKNNAGYGMLRRGGLANKTPAHRISWEIHNGPIPEGMFVLHKCDNPECTNPEHLFLGTPADNMKDKESKGRHGRTEIWRNKIAAVGVAKRKRTAQQEAVIYELYKLGISKRLLSDVASLNRKSIARIIRERS